MRRWLLPLPLPLLLAISTAGDTALTATCTPISQGTCTACKNCKYCKHCSKNGGTCSVCKAR